MKRILVTGAQGQLGRSINHLSRELNHKFHFTTRSDFDISNQVQCERFLSQHEIDVVVNAAAYTDVDGAESDKALCVQTNATNVGMLAKLCQELNIAFIHVSTDYVFDGQQTVPYKEDDLTHPINVYGESKRVGEELALKNCSKSIVVRTSWLYYNEGDNFIEKIIALSKNRDTIQIVADQYGSPTYALHLAKALIALVESEKGYGEIYHYSDEGETSRYELAESVFGLLRSNIRLLPVTSDTFPTVARRPSYSVLSTKKIATLLSMDIPDWQKGVELYLAKRGNL